MEICFNLVTSYISTCHTRQSDPCSTEAKHWYLSWAMKAIGIMAFEGSWHILEISCQFSKLLQLFQLFFPLLWKICYIFYIIICCFSLDFWIQMALFLQHLNQSLLDWNYLLSLPYIAHFPRTERSVGTCSELGSDLKEVTAKFCLLVRLLHISRPTVLFS